MHGVAIRDGNHDVVWWPPARGRVAAGGGALTDAEFASCGIITLDADFDLIGLERLNNRLPIDIAAVERAFAGLNVHNIARISNSDRIRIHVNQHCVLDESRIDLHRAWSETSYQLQALRDNPDCAREQLRHGIEFKHCCILFVISSNKLIQHKKTGHIPGFFKLKI